MDKKVNKVNRLAEGYGSSNSVTSSLANSYASKVYAELGEYHLINLYKEFGVACFSGLSEKDFTDFTKRCKCELGRNTLETSKAWEYKLKKDENKPLTKDEFSNNMYTNEINILFLM